MRQEEADKEVNNVEFEVESKRRALELREKHVESVVAEVSWYMNSFGGLCYLFDLWPVLHLTYVNILQAEAINLKRKNIREEADAKIQKLSHKYEEIVSEVLI